MFVSRPFVVSCQVYPQKVQCQKYQPEHRLTSSDHSPVVATFTVSVDLPRYEMK